MPKKKIKKKTGKKSYAGTELEAGYQKGTDANLFLDRPFMALSNLSKKKGGKEVPVNVQISDYLKSMMLLERSVLSLEKTIENSSSIINSTAIFESKIVKAKIRGKVYSTTKKMIEAVRAYDLGKIKKEDLYSVSGWAENPDLAIEVARIIGKKNEV